MPDWAWRVLMIVVATLLLLGVLGWLVYRDAAVRALVERVEDLSWRRRGGVALAVAHDPRVPWWARAVPLLVSVYLVTPLDIIPDFIPVLGQLDDIVIIGVGLWLMLRAIPPGVLEEHLRAAERSEEVGGTQG